MKQMGLEDEESTEKRRIGGRDGGVSKKRARSLSRCLPTTSPQKKTPSPKREEGKWGEPGATRRRALSTLNGLKEGS